MENMFELFPIDGRKSFYGKAAVVRDLSGYTLLSYGTPVAYHHDSGEFTRLWSGYSVTTMRHVNAFMWFLGYTHGGEHWWQSIPVNVPVKLVKP